MTTMTCMTIDIGDSHVTSVAAARPSRKRGGDMPACGQLLRTCPQVLDNLAGSAGPSRFPTRPSHDGGCYPDIQPIKGGRPYSISVSGAGTDDTSTTPDRWAIPACQKHCWRHVGDGHRQGHKRERRPRTNVAQSRVGGSVGGGLEDPALEGLGDLQHVGGFDVLVHRRGVVAAENRGGLEVGQASDGAIAAGAGRRRRGRRRVEDLQAVDPGAAVGTFDLDLDALADTQQLGDRGDIARYSATRR